MIRRFTGLAEMSEAVADRFVAAAADAVRERGRFVVALVGGSTPKGAYELLAGDPFRSRVDWAKVHVFWGDERYVPPSDPASNEKMAREALLSHVPVPESQIHPIYAPGGPEQAALAYESLLKANGAPFDLVLAGMGPDGHTLSLFPGTLGTIPPGRLCVATQAPVGAADRVTLTPKAVAGARSLLFLVCGSDKAQTLKEVLEGPPDSERHPSQLVWQSTRNSEWWVDREAASMLTC